jgi:adenosylcobinamide-GDP ribazoletransferase
MLGALQFLTRIPIRLRTAPDLTASIAWFPFVGALIGLILAGFTALGALVLPMPVMAGVTVLAGVLLTGAFHEDGLADAADAIGGGWDREQRIRILKDPLHGSYGVAAMSGSIVIRILCLGALSPAVAVAGLIASHTLGRTASIASMKIWPTASTGGLGADYVRAARTGPILLGVTVGIAISALVLGWWIGPAVLAAAIAAAIMGFISWRALGGVTGDILGAIEQVVEIAVLLVVVAIGTRYNPYWN